MKKLGSIFLSVILGLSLVACEKPKEKETPTKNLAEESKTVDKKTDKGTLVLYASTPEDFLKLVTSEFQNKTGIKVEVVTAGTGELYNRIEAEGDNPLGDIMLGGMVESGYMPKQHLWEEYVSPLNDELPEQFRNKNGKVTGFSLVPSALMINKDVLGDIPVTGYKDLLNPALKGKIVMPDPTSTSSGWEQLVNILYAMGDGDTDKGWEFVNNLLGNINGKVLTSSGAVHKGVSNGEYAVGLIAEGMADTYMLKGMKNIEKVFMSEGVVSNLDGIAIIKNAKNMDNAKKFIDFLISKEFQQTMLVSTPPRRAVRDDINVPENSILPAANTIKQIKIDYAYVAKNKAKMQSKFQDLAMNYMK